MAKKYTIILIPEGTNDVRRFKLPRLLVPLTFLVLLAALGLAGFWFQQYTELKAELPNLQALNSQNDLHRAQIKAFSRRMEEFKGQMDKLKSFNSRLKVLANLAKPSDGDAIFGVGGPESSTASTGVRLAASASERRVLSMQRDLEQLQAEAEVQFQIQEELAKYLKERRSILASTPSIWPVKGWVTSGFGNRISPFTGKRQFHAGIDISTRRGTPIKSPADGVVTFIGRDGGFGKLVVVNHGHGVVTRYAHVDKYKVSGGDKIKRGQVIATVGSTGRSTGPHLHYEVLLSGVPTNPMYYILD